MEISKEFNRYWLAGLIFAVIAGAIQWVISYLSSNIMLLFQPGWLWGLIIGIMGVIILIFVPWIYGHLIEWLYTDFISKN